jgi:cell division control protein 6
VDVAAYLRKQREQLGRGAQHVKDFSVFDFNYVPDEPLMREECRRLIDAMLRFDITGIPTHQVVIGARGSGKTLALKFLQRVIPTQTGLHIVYANCREHNTSFKIFAHLLAGDVAGASLTELYNRLLQRCRAKTVVVLDEVDLMSPKDPRREILYLLSRSEKPFMVVMLSNSPHVVKQLDAATRSSLQPEPLHFRNYNAEQIQQILRDRAQRGLRQWDDGQLAEIAALTVRQTNADARVAIKTLYHLVCGLAGDIPACFEQARRDIVVDVVNDLSDPNLLILWAAATSPVELAKPIYQRYARASQAQRAKPFSYVYFYANLSYLQSLGLIALVSTKVDRSYTNRVLLTCERSIVESIYKLRFEPG